MKVRNFLFAGLLISIGFGSCKVSEKQLVDTESNQLETVQEDSVDSKIIYEETVKEIKLYKGERTRHFKLLHTNLEISFDWQRQYLHGKATLIVEPYFYNQSNIILDAKGFEIKNVATVSGGEIKKLNYTYDGNKINIELAKEYSKGQKVNIQMEYIAKPNEADTSNEEVNDRKGLYFINPNGDEKGKPQQIWTHGETDSNSRWFPTIDAPNQKSTQEIFITVDKKYKTLSNGILVYSKSTSDSTRTDYWKMDKPHAPYLFMLAVGEFSLIEDEWNGMKVDYYVEPEFAEYADDIFGRTPEMIGHFSEILNYPFPWDKYSQIVVRDFVSGAMENTTASVFMEDLNVDSRELIDYDWDDIIAHELFHQWFGNLVTCESWANVPLNESFATYGEYLWKMHKEGEDEANYHLYEELDDYLGEAESKKEDLIRFYYEKDIEMFDSHSYAKGGLILHLLRNYLGDEAFFKSLEYYLKSNAFGKAEVHELRLAFEHISGEDLNWFFNQWFLDAGHPKLRIEEEFDMEQDKYLVKVWQDQDLDLYPVYKLPFMLDVWENGEKIQYMIEIDKPYQEFEFDKIEHPELVIVDSEYVLVGEITHKKTAEQYLFQYTNYDDNVRARIDALEYFMDFPSDSISKIVISDALNDPFWVIREQALQVFEKDTTEYFASNEERIVEIALADPHTLVKAGAIAVLAAKERLKYIEIFKSNLYDSSFSVAGQALYAYLQSGTEDVEDVLRDFSKESNFNITSSVADYYIQKQDHTQYAWFSDKLDRYSGGDLWYFIKLFGMYLLTAPEDQVKNGVIELEFIASNHNQFYNRLSAYQSLELLSDVEGVSEIIEQIKANEKDPRIRAYFDQ
jgi:aminopeptidase N